MIKNMFLALALILAPAVSFGIWVSPASQEEVNTNSALWPTHIQPKTNTVQAVFEALTNLPSKAEVSSNVYNMLDRVTNISITIDRDGATNWTWAVTNGEFVMTSPSYLLRSEYDLTEYIRKDDICSYVANCSGGSYSGQTVFTYVPGTYHDGLGQAGLTYQYYTVSGLSAGSRVRVSSWGAGGRSLYNSTWGGGAGGYAYGEFVVGTGATWVAAAENRVTNGMRIVVQVGTVCGRSAVWRDLSGYNASNAVVVAGGGGAGYKTVAMGGSGGGSVGENGFIDDYPSGLGIVAGRGGSSSAGGAGGTVVARSSLSSTQAGNAGVRIWGGDSPDAPYAGDGGDGYYGGGSGSRYTYTGTSPYAGKSSGNGGGAGSGFVHPDMLNGATVPGAWNNTAQAPRPPYTTVAAYGAYAGYPGYPGRVVIQVP